MKNSELEFLNIPNRPNLASISCVIRQNSRPESIIKQLNNPKPTLKEKNHIKSLSQLVSQMYKYDKILIPSCP